MAIRTALNHCECCASCMLRLVHAYRLLELGVRQPLTFGRYADGHIHVQIGFIQQS